MLTTTDHRQVEREMREGGVCADCAMTYSAYLGITVAGYRADGREPPPPPTVRMATHEHVTASLPPLPAPGAWLRATPLRFLLNTTLRREYRVRVCRNHLDERLEAA